MSALTFKLEVFEGPLDLLLHLIRKNKVSIYDIPIASITEQYFEVLAQMHEMDLEVSSEFCVMAAQLLLIKSRMLLPKQEEEGEEDPRAELAARLLEYQKCKLAAEQLKEREFFYRYMYFKAPDDVEPLSAPPPDSYPVEKLVNAFYDVLERTKRREPPPQKTFDGIVRRKVVSVRDKAVGILGVVTSKKRVTFRTLFAYDETKPELVATFLALLELIRESRIVLHDEGEDIVLSAGKSGDTIDGEEFAGDY